MTFCNFAGKAFVESSKLKRHQHTFAQPKFIVKGIVEQQFNFNFDLFDNSVTRSVETFEELDIGQTRSFVDFLV